MSEKFGWCFIGAGSIVKRVMPEMHTTDGGFLASIYAPTFSHAKEITDQYGGVPYITAEEALSDPNVKAAYIATPHTNHMDSTILALKKGVPVLCEKPFAVNLDQTRAMIDEARARKVYLQEGMWTRHNPVFRKVLEWIEAGRIGRVLTMTANMGGRWGQIDPTQRVFDPNRAGGPLLDVGVYAIAASRFIFGEKPERIAAMGELTSTGIDAMTAILIKYPNGGIARLFSSCIASAGSDAAIHGEKGDIIVPNFAAPVTADLLTDTGNETYSPIIPYEGFAYEFNAAMADIRAGRLENEFVSHAYTTEVMETMDDIRSQIGLRFPME